MSQSALALTEIKKTLYFGEIKKTKKMIKMKSVKKITVQHGVGNHPLEEEGSIQLKQLGGNFLLWSWLFHSF